MRQSLQRAWLRRGGLALLLWPLSLLFGIATAIRRRLYRAGVFRSERVPVPVVVVGNVVAGGAGKTPVVMAIVDHLKRQGMPVGVISRGHGRESRACLEVTGRSDPRQVGDEALLIARRCQVPVFVASRRTEAARALLLAHPGVRLLVSDDGLQHYAMERDVEICVFDGRGVGNGWLLPAGPLREPWPRQADLVLRTAGAPGIDGFLVNRKLAGFALRADGARADLSSMAGQPCDAVAGIAQPQAFFDMLAQAGLSLRHTTALPDHDDFEDPQSWIRRDAPLLCTEKDATKLWRTQPQAWAVPLAIDIEPGFWSALEALVRPKLSSPHGPQTA